MTGKLEARKAPLYSILWSPAAEPRDMSAMVKIWESEDEISSLWTNIDSGTVYKWDGTRWFAGLYIHNENGTCWQEENLR